MAKPRMPTFKTSRTLLLQDTRAIETAKIKAKNKSKSRNFNCNLRYPTTSCHKVTKVDKITHKECTLLDCIAFRDERRERKGKVITDKEGVVIVVVVSDNAYQNEKFPRAPSLPL